MDLIKSSINDWKKIIKSKQSSFQLSLQKQGSKQLYQMMTEVDKSCTKLIKDDERWQKLVKDDTIHFLAILQRENRIQIPIEIRQRFKLQPGKFLKIKIESLCEYTSIKEQFFAKLCTDGRITLPWEIRLKLKAKPRQMMRLYLYPEDLEWQKRSQPTQNADQPKHERTGPNKQNTKKSKDTIAKCAVTGIPKQN